MQTVGKRRASLAGMLASRRPKHAPIVRHSIRAFAAKIAPQERKPASDDADIEQMYQRKTPIEHVLLRPGMYIGATESSSTTAWVADLRHTVSKQGKGRAKDASLSVSLVRKEISYSPGLLKLVDEILVNACDNKARDPAGMTCLMVDIQGMGSSRGLEAGKTGQKGGKGKQVDGGGPRITITNDGRGIPIAVHPKEGVYVPDLIFGQLLTGSNFADDKGAAGKLKKVADSSTTGDNDTAGGRHGYGAKLANIFSTEFTVSTVDRGRGLYYRQTWRDNMQRREEPLVVALKEVERTHPDMFSTLLRSLDGQLKDFTRISFTPDLTRFKGEQGVGQDMEELITRRVVDAAGVLGLLAGASLQVSLNGQALPVHDWASYARLYTPSQREAGQAQPEGTMPLGNDDVITQAVNGIPASEAAARLSAIQVCKLGRRAEIAVACAGIRIRSDTTGQEPPSQPPLWTAETLETYNTPGCVASFVNGMHTSRGGMHVQLVQEVVARRVAEYAHKRLKREGGAVTISIGGTEHPVPIKADAITPALVKSHMRLWVNMRMPGPSFDSQSKEALVSGAPAVARALVAAGSTADSIHNTSDALAALDSLVSEKFVRAVAEEGGVYAAVVAGIVSKAGAELARSMRKASKPASDSKIKAIPKLEDANWAGTKRSSECTLILTEGDSAKALAVAGLSVVGRDRYGVFPLRGKLLNVRDVSVKTALENTEVSALMAILGLDLRTSYAGSSPESRAAQHGLRYGRVMIMADQDVDGSHIKGLLINLLHAYWPRLLECCSDAGNTFIQAFVTPVIKARAGGTVREFYSIAQFDKWRATDSEARSRHWTIKYYKGLGTSTSEEGRAYFRALPLHVRPFVWGGQEDGQALQMAFAKDKVEDRKTWIASAADVDEDAVLGTMTDETAPMPLVALPSDGLHAGGHLAGQEGAGTTFASFVNKELIAFSRADLARSVPSVLDGLKPSQRKVLHACFRRAGAGAGGTGQAAVAAALRALRLHDTVPDTEAAPGDDNDDRSSALSVSSSSTADTGKGNPTAGLRLGGEVKVAQLAGYVAEHTAYHHGEASLNSTIVGMAQDYVGSNNVPLLQPVGQFGTRLQGGKDAASARYIFTKLSPASRLLFPSIDDDLLARKEDDGQPVEPVAYLPVLPLLLLNGAAGIGTGWSTNVPPYNPLDVCAGVRAGLDLGWGDVRGSTDVHGSLPDPWSPPFSLHPWWRGFTGGIHMGGEGEGDSCVTWGKAAWVTPTQGSSKSSSGKSKASGASTRRGVRALSTAPLPGNDWAVGLQEAVEDNWLQEAGSSTETDASGYIPLPDEDIDTCLSSGPGGSLAVRVSELPIGRWTEDYKQWLQAGLARGVIKDLREYHTESKAEFVILLTSEGMKEVRQLAAAGAVVTGVSKTLPRQVRDKLGCNDVSGKGKTEARDAATWPGWNGAVQASALDPTALLGPALHAWLRLNSSFSLRNMHAFAASGRIHKYSSPWEVIRQSMPARAAVYTARAARLESVLADAHSRAAAKARFLADVTAGRVALTGKSKASLVQELWAAGYPTAEGSTCKLGGAATAITSTHASALRALPVGLAKLLSPEVTALAKAGPAAASVAAAPGPRSFDYLLSMPMWQLTGESRTRAEVAVTALARALTAAKACTVESLWQADLAACEEYFGQDEACSSGWSSPYIPPALPSPSKASNTPHAGPPADKDKSTRQAVVATDNPAVARVRKAPSAASKAKSTKG